MFNAYLYGGKQVIIADKLEEVDTDTSGLVEINDVKESVKGSRDDLAMAMEARCYNGGEGRTKMKPLKYNSSDRVTYLLVLGFLAAIILLRVFVPFMA